MPALPAKSMEKLKSSLLRKKRSISLHPEPTRCPYCSAGEIVKRGTRQKKFERVQLYQCAACKRTFSAERVKGKTIPLAVIFDGLSYYNLGYSPETSCRFLKIKYGLSVDPSSISRWVEEFKDICRYARMRPYAIRRYAPPKVMESVTLYHRQVYTFRYHRAKIELLLEEDFKNEPLYRLKEFLDNVSTECPHQFFQGGLRMSEQKVNFDMSRVVVREKQNFANRLAQLALQAVRNNKERHETLEKFMIANDSVTVAIEVPVYFTPEDLEHMQKVLGFTIPLTLDKILTGHIDILQVRNGAVHILDYKAVARKEKPINQLTFYALALSRLTGLRLYHFKCGWFDQDRYYEFFPLHVVYKKKPRKSGKHQPDQNQQKNRIAAVSPES